MSYANSEAPGLNLVKTMKTLTFILNKVANTGQSTFSMIAKSLFSQTKSGHITERAFNFLNLNDASENTNWDGMCVPLPESKKGKTSNSEKFPVRLFVKGVSN